MHKIVKKINTENNIMSEINNLPANIGKIEPSAVQNKQPRAEECAEHSKGECPKCDINRGEGVIGQSQVKKPENIATDVEFMKKHPELVKLSDEVFENTLQAEIAKGNPNAYEDACIISNGFVKELAEK